MSKLQAPQWNCGVAENYTITISDPASGAPIPGAFVHLTAFTPSTLSGTTDAGGQVVFRDVIVKSWIVVTTPGKGPPVRTENYSQLLVLASGFSTSTTVIPCPIEL